LPVDGFATAPFFGLVLGGLFFTMRWSLAR